MITAILMATAVWLAMGPKRTQFSADTTTTTAPTWLKWAWVPAVLLMAVMVAGVSGGLWALLAILVAATVWKVGADHLVRRRCMRTEREVTRACRALAGRLSVGEIPAVALEQVAHDTSILIPALQAQQVGADVSTALVGIAAEPGCGGLAPLAHAWKLAVTTGAPLSASANAVAQGTSRRARLSATLESELAGPRASGRLMGFLPAVGIVLGQSVGSGPTHFLTRTLAGQVCLVTAVALSCAGVLWSEAMANHVQKQALG